MTSLKITGLLAAAAETESLDYYNGGNHVQLSYDKSTGEVIASYHTGTDDESWSVYKNPDIVHVGNVHHTTSAERIKEMVLDAMA